MIGGGSGGCEDQVVDGGLMEGKKQRYVGQKSLK